MPVAPLGNTPIQSQTQVPNQAQGQAQGQTQATSTPTETTPGKSDVDSTPASNTKPTSVIPIQPNLVQNINLTGINSNPQNKININLINSNNFNLPPGAPYHHAYPQMAGVPPPMSYPPHFIPPYPIPGAPHPGYPHPAYMNMNLMNVNPNNVATINQTHNLSPADTTVAANSESTAENKGKIFYSKK